MKEIIQQIKDCIQTLTEEKEQVVVAIDGRCGSGKSTLGQQLQNELDCNLIHMDDFFLRPEQRTSERLAIPGENIDHERFLTEVLLPLDSGNHVVYRPYMCSTETLGAPICLAKTNVTLIEGSYSCHPALREFYDLKIFLSVDSETQLQRIIKRNGPEFAERFRKIWIPLEEQYFLSCSVIENCDLIFEN